MILQEIELKGVNLISRHELRMQGKYTRFGFYPAPRKRVSVRLDGHPEINDGDLMVFVMKKRMIGGMFWHGEIERLVSDRVGHVQRVMRHSFSLLFGLGWWFTFIFSCGQVA